MRWRQSFKDELAQYDLRILWVYTIASLIAITYHYYFTSPINYLAPYLKDISVETLSFYKFLVWHAGTVLILFIVPFLAMCLLNHFSCRKYSPVKYTFTIGNYKTGFLLVLLFVIVTVSCHYALVLAGAISPNYYPMCKSSLVENYLLYFLLFELFQLVYIFAFEYFFRGFILIESAELFGSNALVLTLLPYIISKFGKPPIEIYTAVLVGLALGYMTLKAKSFWYAALAHGLLAAIVDILSLFLK